MSESEAYDLAVAHLRRQGESGLKCYSKRVLTNVEFTSLGGGETDLPSGLRAKVWSFAFTGAEEPPGVIVSGGGCVVDVDDETGICRYIGGL
jgi:hypothetical protein